MSYTEAWSRTVYSKLKEILERKPYYWRVLRADDQVTDASLWQNIKKHMVVSHCYIALVGDQNPNVAIEIGRMEAIGRPLLLVKRRDGELPTDLAGRLYIEVDADAMDLRAQLEDQVAKHEFFKHQLGERYLSSGVLGEIGVGEAATRALMDLCGTWQDLIAADAAVLARESGLGESFVRAIQHELESRKS
jgi:hypothetical protein